MNKNIIAGILALLLIVAAVYFASPSFTKKTDNMNQENTNQDLQTVSAQDFKSLLEQYANDENTVLLDVRTKQEFDAGHIEGAEQLDFYQTENFVTSLANMDKNKTYFIYCSSGNRSGKTLQLMQVMGFKKVYNLQGGIQAWRANGFEELK